MDKTERTLAVIPAYRVTKKILSTVHGALRYVDAVVVVDDHCPDYSGSMVQKEFAKNSRVSVIFHSENKGVGGAVKTGFDWALERDFEIIVKIDGDGQMDPSLIPGLIQPIVEKRADYSKGNRFENPRTVRKMPIYRLVGNGLLSLFTKISTGYWSVSDPTNGFVAINRVTLARLEPKRLSSGYFFESDLLFRLSIVRARIQELPMTAIYEDEESSLRVGRILATFPYLHFRNMMKRIIYRYYVRDWTIGSLELPIGLGLLTWGTVFGLSTFTAASSAGDPVTAGQAVLTAIGVILGAQFLLSFISHDIQLEPRN